MPAREDLDPGPSEDGPGPDDPAGDSPLDATERLLGQPRTLSRREVSNAAGIPLLSARRFWHALGFPGVGDDAQMFTDADVTALRHIVELVRVGHFDEPMALSMTRAIARTADRLAAWQSALILDLVMEREYPGAPLAPVADIAATLEAEEGSAPATPSHHPLDEASARQAGELLLALADDLEPLVVYAWRRHLAAALTGLLAQAAADEAGAHHTVGFADMVEFTTLVTRLSDHQVGHLVQRFEALASDVVTAHGGRVVKTIGDEVLFTTDRVAPAAAIALDLVEALAEDPGMPALRVGMSTGDVVHHLGDVFGTTVNRASRLCQVARPGSVLVDDATAASLSRVSGFVMRELRPRPLRGLGLVNLWTLERRVGANRRPPEPPALIAGPGPPPPPLAPLPPRRSTTPDARPAPKESPT